VGGGVFHGLVQRKLTNRFSIFIPEVMDMSKQKITVTRVSYGHKPLVELTDDIVRILLHQLKQNPTLLRRNPNLCNATDDKTFAPNPHEPFQPNTSGKRGR
jgi:hypothetical protein